MRRRLTLHIHRNKIKENHHQAGFAAPPGQSGSLVQSPGPSEHRGNSWESGRGDSPNQNLGTSPNLIPSTQVCPGVARVQEGSFRWVRPAARGGHCLPPGHPPRPDGRTWAKARRVLTMEKSLGPSASQGGDRGRGLAGVQAPCQPPGATLKIAGGGLFPALEGPPALQKGTRVPFQANTLQSPKSDTLARHDPPGVLDSCSFLRPPMASGCHGSSRRKNKTAHYSHPLPGTAPSPQMHNVCTCI